MSDKNEVEFNPADIQKGFDTLKDVLAKKIEDEGKVLKSTVEEQRVKIEAMEAQIKSQAEENKKLNDRRVAGLEDELKKKTFNISKLVTAQIDKRPLEGFEAEVMKAYSEKSNNASTGANGGYTLPIEVWNDIVPLAVAEMPVYEMGMTTLTGLAGEVYIPIETSSHTAYMVNEEEAPTESQAAFGQRRLAPKYCAAYTRVSKSLLNQSSSVSETWIRNSLMRALRLKIQSMILYGTGAGKETKGIKNFGGLTDTTSIGTNGGFFNSYEAGNMVTNLLGADVLNGKLGFLMHPKVLGKMLQERTITYSGAAQKTGSPVVGGLMMSRNQLEDGLGYKVRSTSQIVTRTKASSGTNKTSDVFFGDWSQVVLGLFSGMEILASEIPAMTTRQVTVVGYQALDLTILNPLAFTIIDDAHLDGTTP